MPATFTIKRNFQRRDITYEDILTPDVLLDVCQQLTGQDDYEVVWDDTSYNKGRLAKLEYNDRVFYVSFSEMEVRSRNSFFSKLPKCVNPISFRAKSKQRVIFLFPSS